MILAKLEETYLFQHYRSRFYCSYKYTYDARYALYDFGKVPSELDLTRGLPKKMDSSLLGGDSITATIICLSPCCWVCALCLHLMVDSFRVGSY